MAESSISAEIQPAGKDVFYITGSYYQAPLNGDIGESCSFSFFFRGIDIAEDGSISFLNVARFEVTDAVFVGEDDDLDEDGDERTPDIYQYEVLKALAEDEEFVEYAKAMFNLNTAKFTKSEVRKANLPPVEIDRSRVTVTLKSVVVHSKHGRFTVKGEYRYGGRRTEDYYGVSLRCQFEFTTLGLRGNHTGYQEFVKSPDDEFILSDYEFCPPGGKTWYKLSEPPRLALSDIQSSLLEDDVYVKPLIDTFRFRKGSDSEELPSRHKSAMTFEDWAGWAREEFRTEFRDVYEWSNLLRVARTAWDAAKGV